MQIEAVGHVESCSQVTPMLFVPLNKIPSQYSCLGNPVDRGARPLARGRLAGKTGNSCGGVGALQ